MNRVEIYDSEFGPGSFANDFSPMMGYDPMIDVLVMLALKHKQRIKMVPKENHLDQYDIFVGETLLSDLQKNV